MLLQHHYECSLKADWYGMNVAIDGGIQCVQVESCQPYISFQLKSHLMFVTACAYLGLTF